MALSFTKRLREPIMRGEITCSVRIWHSQRVKVGGRAPLGDGEVVITGVREITKKDITTKLAKRGGFDSVEDLMAIAQHGSGDRIYLVDFKYEPNLTFLPLVQKAKTPTTKTTTKPTRKSAAPRTTKRKPKT
ncbi:MAG TPA: hypothetical protein VHL34_16740 [Rhizomicrobium sp.]|jgi:hypothetical protein|nr:hypothetical protein [Rhizomicrobium sp.]